MKKILILGANGQIAKLVRDRLLKETDNKLTLYLRNSNRLQIKDANRETIIEGDVNDTTKLMDVMRDQDIVYANLGGKFEPMVQSIITAMDNNNVKRLIYVTGLGLYHELPKKFEEWNENIIGHEVMEDTRRAAKIIEDSDIDFTILRCAYMTNEDKVDYELTEKGEEYKGTIISRKSIADLIIKIMQDPDLHKYSSLGIDQPGTDGNKPAGY
ncbi:NAD(P)H-binding protein [Companilactobacillus jidongensis]|uniref:NAD(P)H-binding protein n=1 Tax=Companilactobacillus jidongensis TaxID=2486006 RepID=UPI000F7A42E9|nr:NAD(P)H-binding protein [Companilactobacillus jidongensis]